MIKKHYIHPVLYAILPVLVMYTQNIQEAWPILLVKPVSLSLLLGLISWLTFYFFIREKHKTSIITSVWLILCFSYGHTYLYLANIGFYSFLPIGPHFFLLGLYFSILLFVYFLLIIKKGTFEIFTVFLNIASITLLIMNLVPLIPYEIRRFYALNKLDNYMDINGISKVEYTNKDIDTYPDIYYFVFDRYPNSTISKEYFGYDNTDLIESLEDKGFYVASKSAANFPSSFQSISSSMNISDITFLSDLLGNEYTDKSVVYKELLQDNEVSKFLLNKGYNYYHLGSSWEASKQNKLATENYNLFIGFSEFESFLYENTIFNTLIGKYKGESTYTSIDLFKLHQKNIPYKISKIKDITEYDSNKPKFIFSHFLLPHPPYLLDENCKVLTFEEVRARALNDAYVDQIECAGQVMNDLSNEIIKNSKRPVVIIIQSDEGPFISLDHADEYDYYDIKEKDSIQVHSRIINSYYISDINNKDTQVDYKSIGLTENSSPINSFSILFNYYFGTNLEMLENKTHIFEDPYKPYDFKDVTESIW
jgi:hypothetical protein